MLNEIVSNARMFIYIFIYLYLFLFINLSITFFNMTDTYTYSIVYFLPEADLKRTQKCWRQYNKNSRRCNVK